jgi:hypothetical protein
MQQLCFLALWQSCLRASFGKLYLSLQLGHPQERSQCSNNCNNTELSWSVAVLLAHNSVGWNFGSLVSGGWQAPLVRLLKVDRKKTNKKEVGHLQQQEGSYAAVVTA